MEMLRIQLERVDKFFKTVGLEIIGQQTGFSVYEVTTVSDELSLAFQLTSQRFMAALRGAMKVDEELTKLLANSSTGQVAPKITGETKAKIDAALREILSNTNLAKREITRDYSEEVEKIRLQNGRLNLLQEYFYEEYSDSLSFINAYVAQFEQLFMRE